MWGTIWNIKEDKKLKTEQSKRVIPIHNDLVNLGLVAFKERQEEKGVERLFSDAVLSGDGTYSSTFSKWFSRYLDNIGIKTDKTSFHSFRHNMKGRPRPRYQNVVRVTARNHLPHKTRHVASRPH